VTILITITTGTTMTSPADGPPCPPQQARAVHRLRPQG